MIILAITLLFSTGGSVGLPAPDLPSPPTDHVGDELGTLYFTLTYITQLQILKVHVQKATDLPAKDLNGKSDPYVVVSLPPDKRQKVNYVLRIYNLTGKMKNPAIKPYFKKKKDKNSRF